MSLVLYGDNDVLYQDNFVATARTPFGGQRIFLSRDNIANIISGEDPNSVPHEAGHSPGWLHPETAAGTRGWSASQQELDESYQDNKSNLMHIFDYLKLNGVSKEAATGLT